MTSSDVSFGQAMSGAYNSLVVFRTKEGLWLESENVMVFEAQFPSENKKLQNGNGIDESVFRGLGKTRKVGILRGRTDFSTRASFSEVTESSNFSLKFITD